MDYAKVVGIENASYVKDGQTKIGTRLYIARHISPDTGIGVSVREEYISGRPSSDFKLGDIITPIYEPGFGDKMRCTGVLYVDDFVHDDKKGGEK